MIIRYFTTLFIFLFLLSAEAQELQRRGSFGIEPVPVTEELKTSLGLQKAGGILVNTVFPNMTYSALNGQRGDVILKINQQDIEGVPQLMAVRNKMRADDPMTIQVWRDGKTMTLQGKVQAIPYEQAKNAEVIYDAMIYKGGKIRLIINKPNKAGKHPTIFFVPGYTCSSIDNLSGIHPYRKLIDSLSNLGYAIFRMEKPGIGDNEDTGDCQQLGFDNELEAYRVAYKQLRHYDFIDTENVFIWGHSMGGLYAPLIAREVQPKGVIIYGITHELWPEYLLKMIRYQNPLLGNDYVETERDLRALYALIYEHYYQHKSSKELAKNPAYKTILERDFAFDGENQILYRHEDFWRELAEHPLSEAWAQTRSHILSMYGGADMEAVNDVSQKEIVRLVNHYHPGYGTFQLIPETDHSMIRVGSMEEGAKIRSQPGYRRLLETQFNYDIVTHTHQWIQQKLEVPIAKAAITATDWRQLIRKEQLTTSLDTFDMIWEGKVSGSMIYHKQRQGNRLVICDTSELTGLVRETLRMELDVDQLSMQTSEIQMTTQQSGLAGQLQWENDRHLKGSYTVKGQNGERQISVDTIHHQTLMGRGAIFGLVEGLPLSVGTVYPLDLFAFSSAEIWNMVLKVEEKMTIDFKGKTLEVFKLSLTGGKVDNNLYLTADGRNRLVRVDVPDQNMVIELVSKL
ncbi:MAG: hypothetical protein DHS20C18_54110 [Saprospiraceae bacterium]|nr:MAG: hypothetical protein DHS20C18_54110 [Saprospiraceae bacterium]